jgi:hypothetical protein
VEGHSAIRLDPRQGCHQALTQPLHVVILAKTHWRPHARAHVVLFSSDLALAYAPLVHSDSLRFHIEIG